MKDAALPPTMIETSVSDGARTVGDVDSALAARLWLVVARLARRIRLETTDDLSPLQVSVLVRIEECSPLRLGELAQKEHVTAPTMTRVVAALADRGLIERAPDPWDGRSAQVSLSEAGREHVHRVRLARIAQVHSWLLDLTPAQRESASVAIPALEALVACHKENHL